MNRTAALKLAASLPKGDELRRALLARLIESKEHATEEAREKYLKEHPDADPRNHTVKQKDDKGGKSEKPHKAQGKFDKAMKRYKQEKGGTSGPAQAAIKAVEKALSSGSEGDAQKAVAAYEAFDKHIWKGTDLRPGVSGRDGGLYDDLKPVIRKLKPGLADKLKGWLGKKARTEP